MQTSETLSAREAALALNMNDRTLRRAIKRGDLKASVGPTRNSPMRITRVDLDEYAAKLRLPESEATVAEQVNGVVEPETHQEHQAVKATRAETIAIADGGEQLGELRGTLAAVRRLLALEPSPELWAALRAVVDVPE